MRSYLIAITPPKEICLIVDKHRAKYSAGKIAGIPPHITLHPSFHTDGINQDELIRLAESVAANQNQHKVDIIGISYFEGNNNVLYFNPDSATQEFTRSMFIALSHALSGQIKNKFLDFIVTPDNFTAHMTIADKIPDDIFETIKRESASFDEEVSFTISSIDIYFQEEGSKIYNLLKKLDIDPSRM